MVGSLVITSLPIFTIPLLTSLIFHENIMNLLLLVISTLVLEYLAILVGVVMLGIDLSISLIIVLTTCLSAYIITLNILQNFKKFRGIAFSLLKCFGKFWIRKVRIYGSPYLTFCVVVLGVYNCATLVWLLGLDNRRAILYVLLSLSIISTLITVLTLHVIL